MLPGGGIIMTHEATQVQRVLGEMQPVQGDGIIMAHEATELQPLYCQVG